MSGWELGGGGSTGSSGGALAVYTLVQKDTTGGTYKYYGYEKADGSWAVKRVKISTNFADFKTGGAGTSDFGDDFLTWASGLTGWQAYEAAF